MFMGDEWLLPGSRVSAHVLTRCAEEFPRNRASDHGKLVPKSWGRATMITRWSDEAIDLRLVADRVRPRMVPPLVPCVARKTNRRGGLRGLGTDWQRP